MVMDPHKILSSKGSIYKLVKKLLLEEGIRLKKKLSQTFLVDVAELEYISSILRENATKHQCIAEIGAGVGNLTTYIASLNSDKILIAIEVDKRFTRILKAIQEAFPNVDIIIGDALKIVPSMRGCDIVVGNLPYYITSPLLVSIAKSTFNLALITIQKEVAERITAKAGSKDYGKITAFLQHLFEVTYIKTIPLYKFYPKPHVHSAIVLLKRKKAYDTTSQLLEHLIKCLFSFRRKTVDKALKRCLEEFSATEICGSLEIWKKRVYQLTVEDLEKMIHMLANQRK